MQTAELLANVPLFKLLDGSERADLEIVLERQERSAGELIFSFGEPGESLYIVAAGSVELFVKDNSGAKIVLTNCGVGEPFGELSLLDGGARTASAVALEDSTLFVLGRDNLLSFLRLHPDAALDFLTMLGQRVRNADEMLRRRVARNINEEHEVRTSAMDRVADAIAAFSGSIAFLILNALWFAVWIGWNVAPFLPHFDPYPFGFLTMVVSLEAIFLSIFVLVSQNRQAAKDHLRADADYEVNLKAELEISHLHEKVDFLTEQLLARLPRSSP
jgi:CRP/FNR family transcriptional regulator, cyclic AMP receptor protein